MSNWQPFDPGFIHVSYANDELFPRFTRKEKDALRRLHRFLNTRVKWSASFAQELQGRAIMRGVFAAAARRK